MSGVPYYRHVHYPVFVDESSFLVRVFSHYVVALACRMIGYTYLLLGIYLFMLPISFFFTHAFSQWGFA